MAQRRMFSLQIVDSDAFLDMPASSQLLYFHLAMRADDDGFVDNPKKIMRSVSSSDDDIKLLLAKRFILSFESGVVVIKHWQIHNYIAKDRYHETKYLEEKKTLLLKDNGSYTECIQNDDSGKVRIGKVRQGKAILATPLQEVVNHFFLLKGWNTEEKSKVVYARFVRPAKDLLELCESDVNEAKDCLSKVSEWAKSRDLEWSIETVFKKWYEIDALKPKDKKPHYDGCRIFQKVKGGKWWIIRNGDIKELGITPKKEEIQWM